mgnify:CR=1 FL=1
MVKVQFKNNYENVYSGKEYTYKDYEGAAVGDIVVVNTNCGFAIARVSQVNISNYDYDINKLKSVAKIIVTQQEIEKEKEAKAKKQAEIEVITAKLRKAYLIDALGKGLDATERLTLTQMSNEDLEQIYENLNSF